MRICVWADPLPYMDTSSLRRVFTCEQLDQRAAAVSGAPRQLFLKARGGLLTFGFVPKWGPPRNGGFYVAGGFYLVSWRWLPGN